MTADLLCQVVKTLQAENYTMHVKYVLTCIGAQKTDFINAASNNTWYLIASFFFSNRMYEKWLLDLPYMTSPEQCLIL